jgi:hypothetical protein
MSHSNTDKIHLRVVPGARVVGTCMDCGWSGSGYIAVRFFEYEGERGLEIFITTGNGAHAIARIEDWKIPRGGLIYAICPATPGA